MSPPPSFVLQIKIAAADWVANSTEATKIWGPIADWNVSLVSQFDNLFPLEFNEGLFLCGVNI